MEQIKRVQEESEQKFKKDHPFQPKTHNFRHSLAESLVLTPERISKMAIPKTLPIDMRLTTYAKNRYDLKTDQEFFTPKINKYKPITMQQAYQAKVDSEFNVRSMALNKKTKAVFNFLSVNTPYLHIKQFDSLNIKNECITLLKEVIIVLIKENTEVDYDQFLNLMIENNLLFEIERAYDYICKKNDTYGSRSPLKTIKRVESDITKSLYTEFDKNVRKVYKEEFLRESKFKVQHKHQNRVI